MEERDIVIHIEGCIDEIEQQGSGRATNDKIVSLTVSVDELSSAKTENLTSLSSNVMNVVGGGVSPVTEKEKRKSMSAKKPPRPPRGLSLDTADQRLIKELSELAMIKRARIERMKKMKAAKAAASSTATSSAGNFVAMLITILVCIVIIFRGCHAPRPTEIPRV